MLPEEKRIHTKADLNRFLDIELKQYGVKRRGIKLLCREEDVLALYNIILRKCEYHKNNGHKLRYLFYRIRLGYLQNRYFISVKINCCEEGLKIMHIGTIRMNKDACVGKYCSLHVNSGLVARGNSNEAPTLGDGVVVGMGAIVVGGVKIANNVAIGANAVVTKDILEENVAVAGVPARIISHNGRLNWKNTNTK